MASSRPKVALILTGGGARAAYQVGVLRGLAELIPEGASNPFAIICGTSAGAINAAALAADAADFRRAVRRLMVVWKHFQVRQVYRADPWGAFYNSARWLLGVATGGAFSRRPVSLLDNSPLVGLLGRYLDFSAIQRSIDAGHLAALSVTCSGYSSGQSVTFFQGKAGLQGWQRARRVGVPTTITLEHLLASSALPFIFPPVHINREYFGDGSMRQIAPVSPALHLGADRLLVIGTGRDLPPGQERVKSETFPSLAQIAGHTLNSIFLDSLEVDLERMQRINRTIALVPPEVLERNRYPLRHVDFRMLAPSEELERIALANAHELPRTIRILLQSVGAVRRSGANLLSYLLFEKSYCRALIRLGYEDTMRREDDLAAFFGWQDSGV
jgi:NTE family protein